MLEALFLFSFVDYEYKPAVDVLRSLYANDPNTPTIVHHKVTDPVSIAPQPHPPHPVSQLLFGHQPEPEPQRPLLRSPGSLAEPLIALP